MAIIEQPDQIVQYASDEDVAAATVRALNSIGVTYDELAAQAQRSEFQSERARRVWFMISPLAD